MYCGAVEFVCAPSMVKHVPVLLEESLGFLQPENGGRFADLTYGGGGHSDAILGASEEAELVSFDCDPDAQVRSERTSSQFGDRFTFHDLSFQRMDEVWRLETRALQQALPPTAEAGGFRSNRCADSVTCERDMDNDTGKGTHANRCSAADAEEDLRQWLACGPQFAGDFGDGGSKQGRA